MKLCLIKILVLFAVFWLGNAYLDETERAESERPHHIAPKIDINLDLPPRERWMDTMKRFSHLNQEYRDYFDYQLSRFGIGRYIVSYVSKLLSWVFSDELKEEMTTIEGTLDLQYGMVEMFHLSYELRKLGGGVRKITDDYPDFGNVEWDKPLDDVPIVSTANAACTSIIAGNNHARNLDWLVPAGVRNGTYQATFYRNNKPHFIGSMFAGYFGILTGMKPGKFSISINARHICGNSFTNIWNLIKGHMQPPILIRKVLDEAESFDEAVDMLSNIPITAPVYFTVAGAESHQGCLLSRNRYGLDDIMCLQPVDVDQKPTEPYPEWLPTVWGDWYIMVTNYDHWLRPPTIDSRRYYAMHRMDSEVNLLRHDINPDVLWRPLKTWPIQKKNTCYTSLMNPSKNYMETIIVYDEL